MNFVLRAQALYRIVVRVLPLAVVAAMSIGSAHAAASFDVFATFCAADTLTVAPGATIDGVTGVKLTGGCSDSGENGFTLLAGAFGQGSGELPAGMTQLMVTYDFTAVTQSGFGYDWSVSASINNGLPDGAEAFVDGTAQSGDPVSGSFFVDISGLASRTLSAWSLFISVSRFDEVPDGVTITIPDAGPVNSLDFNGTPIVDEVPEPGTIGLILCGAALLGLSRLRSV